MSQLQYIALMKLIKRPRIQVLCVFINTFRKGPSQHILPWLVQPLYIIAGNRGGQDMSLQPHIVTMYSREGPLYA